MNFKQFDLNLLNVFHKLYTTGSVSQAADEMCISQSAFSHALARLRASLNDPLFVRENNQMKPTDRAHQLAQYTERALPLIQQGLSSVTPFEPLTSEKTFRIAATDFSEFCLLPTLTKHLAVVAPKVKLQVLPASPLPVKQQLQQGDLDFVLGFQHQDIEMEGVKHLTWLSGEYATLVCRNHSQIQNQITFQQFLAQKHILIAPWGENAGIVDNALASLDVTRQIACQQASVLVAPYMVSNSDYVLTLPKRIAHLVADKLDLQVLKPPLHIPEYHLQLYWHKTTSNNAATLWFIEQIEMLFGNPKKEL